MAGFVQDHVVVDELDVARLELDVEVVRRIVGERVEQVEGLDLARAQPRHVGEALRRLDVVPVAVDHRQLPFMPMEDRRLVPALPARRDLAAAVEAERLEQDGGELWTPAKHLVVERDRADDAAQAAGLRGLEAEQPDDVD
jgi:hypothetical protein